MTQDNASKPITMALYSDIDLNRQFLMLAWETFHHRDWVGMAMALLELNSKRGHEMPKPFPVKTSKAVPRYATLANKFKKSAACEAFPNSCRP